MFKLVTRNSHGIELPELNIGLDVSSSFVEYIFISHAHADHVPQSSRLHVYATPPTAEFMRLRGFKGSITEAGFKNPIELPGTKVTFLPAGHILGSAMVLIESDGHSLLYTGDYRYPPSPVTEGFELPEHVDQFITEATFSLPVYKWQPTEMIYEEIRDFASDTIRNGLIPAFQAYSLGKTQELLHALAPLDIPVHVPENSYPLCRAYQNFGYDMGNYQLFNPTSLKGNILVAPGLRIGQTDLSQWPDIRLAYVSGWAATNGFGQTAADRMIPLSDHIDFFELISVCEKLRPAQVYITHTPNPDVVCYYLKNKGINALPLKSAMNDDE